MAGIVLSQTVLWPKYDVLYSGSVTVEAMISFASGTNHFTVAALHFAPIFDPRHYARLRKEFSSDFFHEVQRHAAGEEVSYESHGTAQIGLKSVRGDAIAGARRRSGIGGTIMDRESGNETKVKCAVCLREIPQSEAKSAEAIDYVMYFCGLDCFEKWQTNNRLDELAVGGD